MLFATAFSRAAQAQEPTVFSVKAGGAHGTAFVVTGVPGIDGPAVVTALHVVGGHSLVELRLRDCSDRPIVKETDQPTHAFKADASVWVWKELDLVAFPLPDGSNWKATSLPSKPVAVASDEDVKVLGLSALSPCPRGGGKFWYTQRTARLVEHLIERTQYTASDLGTLDKNAWLLFMSSSGSPGVSGGAVLDDDWRLLGLYQGGGSGSNSTNWAVRVSVIDLNAFPSKKQKLKELPRVGAAKLTEAQLEDFVRKDSEEKPTGAFLALHGGVFHEVGNPSTSGFSLELGGYAPFAPARSNSWGLFAGVGGELGQSERIIRGPFSQRDDERSEAGMLQLAGTLGLGLRFLQQSWIRVGVTAGYRVGGRWVENTPEAGTRLQLVHGPQLRSYPCVSVVWQLSICLALGLGALKYRPEKYGLDVGSRVARQGAAQWQPDISLGSALAWGSWIRVKPLELP